MKILPLGNECVAGLEVPAADDGSQDGRRKLPALPTPNDGMSVREDGVSLLVIARSKATKQSSFSLAALLIASLRSQ
jgi:hypothetical protein